MKIPTIDVEQFLTEYFSSTCKKIVIDCRSEAEFNLGHIPEARNLALLTNDERQQVGITYRKEGRSAAVGLGLEFFAQKADHWLDSLANILEANTRVWVYCWRGGMRSAATALWLKERGFAAQVIAGGYKKYRNHVLQQFERLNEKELLVLIGRTGVGKTAFLRKLQAEFPIIDFEGMARHRGSAFGDFDICKSIPPQTQQQFENELGLNIWRFSNCNRIIVEFETVLGPVRLPQSVINKIQNSDKILLTRDFENRAELIEAEYTQNWDDQTTRLFCDRLSLLSKVISKDQMQDLVRLINMKKFNEAIKWMLIHRYDKAYDKSITRYSHQVKGEFNLTRDEAACEFFCRSWLSN